MLQEIPCPVIGYTEVYFTKTTEAVLFPSFTPMTLLKSTRYADTVGQYTGVKDKNGTRIFEGDIVDISRDEERGVIKWDEDTARFIISSDGISADFDNYWGKDLEVIGNIYDNQELCDDIGGI